AGPAAGAHRDGAARHYADGVKWLARTPVAPAYPLVDRALVHVGVCHRPAGLVAVALCAEPARSVPFPRADPLRRPPGAEQPPAAPRHSSALRRLRPRLHDPD